MTAYRGKGGVRGRRELPAPAVAVVKRSLADFEDARDYGAPIPVAGGVGPAGISSATCYARFRDSSESRAAARPGSASRHTAAKLRRMPESVESVSAFPRPTRRCEPTSDSRRC